MSTEEKFSISQYSKEVFRRSNAPSRFGGMFMYRGLLGVVALMMPISFIYNMVDRSPSSPVYIMYDPISIDSDTKEEFKRYY